MKVKDSTAVQCRYGEYIKDLYGDWDVIMDKSDACHYFGEVNLIAQKDNDVMHLQFCYGSCSVCDDWEARELTSEDIIKEIKDLTLLFTKEEFLEFSRRRE